MAKKTSKESVEGVNGPPKTPEEILDEHWSPIRAARIELKKAQKAASAANSIYRNELKAFKKAGGHVEALLDAIRISEMDPEDATRQMQRTNIYMLRMGLPVGTQFGLFEDGESVASKGERAKVPAADDGPERVTEAALKAIREDGFAAGLNGKNANGGGYEVGSPSELAWTGGWREGQERLAEGLGPKPAAAATAPTVDHSPG